MTYSWSGARAEDLAAAAGAIQRGELVAFPTETVYGLGADGLDGAAVAKIYQAKGRPSDNPLILHIADQSQLVDLVSAVPPHGQALIDAFWPGPLTLIMPASSIVPTEVTAGLATVAIRQPDDPVALALLRLVGRPVAAPSANTSGRPSPTEACHVYDDLAGKIAGIVDGGPTSIGLESTILDLTVDPPAILRPGGISRKQLEAVIGPVQVSSGEVTGGPKAPGMKYRHYAPQAPLYVLEAAQIGAAFAEQLAAVAQPVGLLLSSESLVALGPLPPGVYAYPMGSRADVRIASHAFYRALRYFDDLAVGSIYIEAFSEEALGEALMNRVRKASIPPSV